jgi:hypothetical protein
MAIGLNSDDNLGILNGVIGTDFRNLLKTESVVSGAMASSTATIPFDNTIPQITEGFQVLSISYTPISDNSKLVIETFVCSYSVNNMPICTALFQSGISNTIGCSFNNLFTDGGAINSYVKVDLSNTNLTSKTFSTRIGGSSAIQITFNGKANTAYYGDTLKSFIQVSEYV